jgi:hypothetical protein
MYLSTGYLKKTPSDEQEFSQALYTYLSHSIKVGNEEVVNNTRAFIDSSKSAVVGPTAEINKINGNLGCTESLQGSSNVCKVI